MGTSNTTNLQKDTQKIDLIQYMKNIFSTKGPIILYKSLIENTVLNESAHKNVAITSFVFKTHNNCITPSGYRRHTAATKLFLKATLNGHHAIH